MAYPSDIFVAASKPLDGIDCGLDLPDDWLLAREALMDLQLVRMPRVNLLLVGPDSVIQNVLEMLRPSLQTPIENWCPSQRLALPPFTGTMVLRDVDALTLEDQRRLVGWLELCVGRTQVISTTSFPLLPRVEAGTFLDTLYYRLNTVCVDVTP